MIKRSLKIISVIFLLAFAAWAVLFFKNDIADFFEGLPEVQQPTVQIITDLTQKTVEVLAPEPLRVEVEKFISGADLSGAGIIKYTNEHRAQNSLGSLIENEKLRRAALAKIDDMFQNQYFDHVSPSGNGPSYLAQNAGYEYIMIGENLALGGFDGDSDLVQAWMDSPGHRENILHPKYTEIGVAAKKGVFEGKTVWLAVQEFGRPVSDCPSVDGSLKDQLSANTLQIKDMDAEINALQVELKSMKRAGNRQEYNAKVDEYNALVESYNSIVAKTKEMTATYNAQVAAYNACVSEE